MGPANPVKPELYSVYYTNIVLLFIYHGRQIRYLLRIGGPYWRVYSLFSLQEPWASPPSAGITYSSLPFSSFATPLFDVKRILFPSGDHTGSESLPDVVNFLLVPFATST